MFGEGCIGQRVFVRAADEGICRERREAIERRAHRGGIALEHAPTAQTKERIAAEQQAMPVVGDVGSGVPMHLEHVESIRIGIDHITRAHSPGGEGDARFMRCDDRRIRPPFQQRRNAANVVVVVMGEQDCGQCLRVAKVLQDGQSIAGIHQERPMRAR